MPTPFELPEPRELHARVSVRGELDWGEPLPSRAEIGSAYGEEAATRSLELLTRAADVEPSVTADVVDAIGSEGFPYHLKNRLKSPQSLARKVGDRSEFRPSRPQLPEDVLRYTVGTDHPHQLVETAVRTVDRLLAKGWTMDSAHHSYLDGSRYKGLHVFLRSRGQAVEIQVQSHESLAVKEATTPLYEVERDPDQPTSDRAEARATAKAMSAGMTQPAGIDELGTLGGVPVQRRRYGGGEITSCRGSGSVGQPEQDSGRAKQQEQRREQGQQDGITR